MTNLPALVTIISVPREKNSSQRPFISRSTLTCTKLLSAEDDGEVGVDGGDRVEDALSSNNLLMSFFPGGLRAFFPVPAFRSLSGLGKNDKQYFSHLHVVVRYN